MSTDQCPRCGGSLLTNAKFCGRCAFPVTFSAASGVTSGEWTAQEHEFAVRIRPQQLKALFSKGINVDESQTGLLFESGRFEHELTPGRQKLESLPDRIRRYVTGETASAVLIRRGLYPLSILGTALTPTGDEISFDCEIGLQVGDRNAFYVNLMQSSDSVTSGDLMQRFGSIARQAVFAVIASCGSTELLNIHPELQQRLVDAVADAVTPVAERWGLAVSYVAPPIFSNKQLSQFQKERAQLVRDLRDQRLKQKYAEEKDQIEIRRFQTSRLLAEAKIRDAVEQAERTSEFDQVKADLRHQQTLHGLQLEESMAAAIDSFAARRRGRKDSHEDAGSLRAHLLAVTDIERQQALAELKFNFRKQALGQQHELDDLTRDQQTKAAAAELAAELDRLNATQIGQIDRWRRQREAQREDRVAESEVQAKASQIVGDAQRATVGRDFDESHRQRTVSHDQNVRESHAGIDLKVTELEKLSQVQTSHLDRLQDVARKQQEHAAQAEKSKHELSEDAKERDHKRKMDELQLLKDSPEMMQLLKMAELAVQSPVMSQAFGDVMKMMMAKGMTGEQLEQVMASQSPEVAKTLQEKYRTQAAVAQNSSQQQLESLERIITELKTAREISGQQMTDFMNRLERTGINGQEMLRDVGVAAGSRGDQPGKPLDAKQLKELLDKVEELKKKLDSPNRDYQA